MNWIDITALLSGETPLYPGDQQFELIESMRIADGDICNLSALKMSAHAGTHVDAPFHFDDSGIKMHELSLDALIGPAYVLDARGRIEIDAERIEKAPECERLLLKTDNEGGMSRSEFDKDHAYLSPDGAALLVERGIRLVGIDYLSVEKFGARPETHWTLCKAGAIIVEGLDLGQLNEGWHDLIVLPLKLKDADGAPARAVARPIQG
ncbi:MAG: cyclase family protein [Armatimonadetes bacterium]|nr:cyclase family protein [Armatimonadota bacterium]